VAAAVIFLFSVDVNVNLALAILHRQAPFIGLFLSGAGSLSDLRLICCAGGKGGSYFPAFSLHRTTMRLKIQKICARFPTLLATIT
jgi:hypothetical protein